MGAFVSMYDNSVYPLIDASCDEANLEQCICRIEYGFAFSSQPRDDEFNGFNIEQLLDQAADLLERGIRTRDRWDEISEKYVNLSLALEEFRQLNEVRLEEEQEGFDAYENQTIAAELASQELLLESQVSSLSLLKDIKTAVFSPASVEKQISASKKAASLTGRVGYLFKGQEFLGYKTYEYLNNGIADKARGDGGKEVSELAGEAAETQANISIDYQRISLDEQIALSEGYVSSSKERIKSTSLNLQRSKDSADFLKKRTLVARSLNDLRLKAVTDANGALNYVKRLQPLQQLFYQDFRDALARLNAIQKPLQEIYGYDVQLPEDRDSIQFFDDCLCWTRKTVQWLIRFSQTEQNIILPISIRSLIGKQAFHNGLEKGAWTFAVARDLFPFLSHVRLRGISAYTSYDCLGKLASLTTNPYLPLQFEVPKRAIVTHIGGNQQYLDQSATAPCLIMNTGIRRANEAPLVAGRSALINCSPFGEWSVKILTTMPNNNNQKVSINDIQLDLYLAYRYTSKN